MADIKVFGRWSTEGIKVEDPGLIDYIALTPALIPRSGARYAGKRFHKSKVFIVERFINKLMVPGHRGKKHMITSYRTSGRSQTAQKLVETAFGIIEKRTKKNPVEVFVKAVENASPREEIIAIEYGGAVYPKAIECSPQRRIDLALRYFVQGSFQSAFNKKKKQVDALADEIVNAYHTSSASAAIAKKLELERQADASR